MIHAISPIGSYSDPEYLRILRELMKLGIAPSGNKAVDKGKLERAKEELVQKIQNKEFEQQKKELQIQPLEAAKEVEKSRLEELRPGAMTVAELNRLYFGIV